MAQLPWVKIFAASLEMLMILPEEKAGRVIQAAGRYFKYGELPEKLDSTEAIVFERLKENVDESAENYSSICRRNRNNARGVKEAICRPCRRLWGRPHRRSRPPSRRRFPFRLPSYPGYSRSRCPNRSSDRPSQGYRHRCSSPHRRECRSRPEPPCRR